MQLPECIQWLYWTPAWPRWWLWRSCADHAHQSHPSLNNTSRNRWWTPVDMRPSIILSIRQTKWRWPISSEWFMEILFGDKLGLTVLCPSPFSANILKPLIAANIHFSFLFVYITDRQKEKCKKLAFGVESVGLPGPWADSPRWRWWCWPLCCFQFESAGSSGSLWGKFLSPVFTKIDQNIDAV